MIRLALRVAVCPKFVNVSVYSVGVVKAWLLIEQLFGVGYDTAEDELEYVLRYALLISALKVAEADV
tara:strand:+ start:525 stop:725 length:201 start_codon:yes stop_codon:yes gene_type:complete